MLKETPPSDRAADHDAGGASRTCWVVTDGKAGTQNQCVGLAEAVGLPTTVKRIRPRAPWRFLPPRLWAALLGNDPARTLAPDSDTLLPPWPSLLIAAGRASVPYAIALGRFSAGTTYRVQLQNPRVPSRLFDLVVPPRHDRVSGANVLATRGALHRVTAERLAADAARVAPSLAHLPRPLVAVLIGGANKYYRLTPRVAQRLAAQFAGLCREAGAGLAVTPSRRTGPENAALLRAHLGDAPAVVWDGTGDNPYFGYLGLADAVVVSPDSVSMASEACATGKPVYVIELEGSGRKFRAFHEALHRDGLTRPFSGRLDSWSYTPLDDTAAVAAEVKRRMGLPV